MMPPWPKDVLDVCLSFGMVPHHLPACHEMRHASLDVSVWRARRPGASGPWLLYMATPEAWTSKEVATPAELSHWLRAYPQCVDEGWGMCDGG